MKDTLKFLLEVNKLKTMSRTGWVLAGVKNPENVTEHVFGLAITAWILGEKKKLNIKKLIQTTLSHDLCEVYAGDITPFFYYPRLPEDKEKRKKVLMKWARLSRKEKGKIGKVKFEKEKKSLLALIKYLNPKLEKEIFSLWLEYEKGILRGGKFARQLNRIETLLQSIEYFGTKDIKTRTNWWEWVEEIAEDPLLLKFLKVLHNKFYDVRTEAGKEIKDKKLKNELENILDFLFEIGKLKKLQRRIWRLLRVKEPLETVASHIFSVTLMAWIFGQEEKLLNMEKLLKMALCHEIAAVYTGDLTSYDKILEKRKRKDVFKKWLRLSREEKRKIYLENYKEERAALEKLTSKLKPSLKKEIIQLFDEYKNASTPEARFLSQVNVLAVLLQALLYQKKDKNLQIDWMWEWTLEKCENSAILEFIEALKKKFY
jgi:putative hydrolase of HD superfamily